jgi:hypothetical protein
MPVSGPGFEDAFAEERFVHDPGIRHSRLYVNPGIRYTLLMARMKQFARRMMLRLTIEMADAIEARRREQESLQDFVRAAIEREIERRDGE